MQNSFTTSPVSAFGFCFVLLGNKLVFSVNEGVGGEPLGDK